MAVLSQECQTRKCGGCTGDGDWSDELEQIVPCGHHCHSAPVVDEPGPAATRRCACFFPEPSEDDPDLCVCSHAMDEHDRTDLCQVMVPAVVL